MYEQNNQLLKLYKQLIKSYCSYSFNPVNQIFKLPGKIKVVFEIVRNACPCFDLLSLSYTYFPTYRLAVQLVSPEKNGIILPITYKNVSMTLEDFNILGDNERVQVIFEANKIFEKIDCDANFQLFQINNFYVETKTSLEGKFKRTIKTFSLKDLPTEYAGEILNMPIVTAGNEEVKFPEVIISKKKKSLL